MKKYITPKIDIELVASLSIMAASYTDPADTNGGKTDKLSAPKRNVF